jgi:hypothetical protein
MKLASESRSARFAEGAMCHEGNTWRYFTTASAIDIEEKATKNLHTDCPSAASLEFPLKSAFSQNTKKKKMNVISQVLKMKWHHPAVESRLYVISINPL